ncbi:hypothetical protein RvY_09943-1 [Ramazzottius varieornatus]|uniref:Uncharacterized protein n=1 Tax=Ramazzottius varieornatus TaxID=947166 RepID=A0A1D1VB43_RAMVA|nr:hypothetical protein RvY_09943-1 [Ramazzottius varieornatus]
MRGYKTNYRALIYRVFSTTKRSFQNFERTFSQFIFFFHFSNLYIVENEGHIHRILRPGVLRCSATCWMLPEDLHLLWIHLERRPSRLQLRSRA